MQSYEQMLCMHNDYKIESYTNERDDYIKLQCRCNRCGVLHSRYIYGKDKCNKFIKEQEIKV